MANEVIFEARHMHKAFGPTIALKDVDFQLHRGEIRGLVGENGSGKSTIMSIASGMQPATSGEMLYLGKPWKPATMVESQNAGISMILQEANTIPGVTVAQNLFAGSEKDFSCCGVINMFKSGFKEHFRNGVGKISEFGPSWQNHFAWDAYYDFEDNTWKQGMQQPVAKDLRVISAALKMITDMERIGDQTADIADAAKYLTSLQFEIHPAIFIMGDMVSKMVDDSVNAFVRRDRKLARQVISADDMVDELFNQLKEELVDEIKNGTNRDHAGYQLDMLMIIKYLERIGDHATNIGEWVIYSIEGQK